MYLKLDLDSERKERYLTEFEWLRTVRLLIRIACFTR